MRRPPVPLPAGHRRPAVVRTYLVLAIGSAAGATDFVRTLGTVTAPGRSLAREAARALHPGIAADELRVVAAAGSATGLLAAALAADGRQALVGQD